MKVLIYHSKSFLAPIGGPSGYLYGLKEVLDKKYDSDIQIDFLPEVVTGNKQKVRTLSKTSSSRLMKKLTSWYQLYKNYKFVKTIIGRNSDPIVDIHQYDVIHFHSTKDYYLLREELKKYKGKTVLTSHSPQPLSGEFIDRLSNTQKLLLRSKLKSIIEMDRYAFENADYILFPCENADEPYVHEWPEYSSIRERRKKHYRYLVTGTTSAKIKTDRCSVRKKLNIPEDAFVISYVGRHNQIKGYDRLKEIGKKFLEKHPDAYVVVAGKEEPIKGLSHPHWIEIGWTNEPHSYVNASDLFILPNRETYFDLVMLEVLSTGKYSLISNTGGNKYFKQYVDAGIRYFDTVDDAIDSIEYVYKMEFSERLDKENINKEIYSENFTTEIFADNYIEFYKKLF
ncbi:MAG: glycosyltransferase family 4 protein [Ruminococcus sp.]|nr:glycosyltransferase family 4 protein [Ruminococcus sp.]